MKSLRRHYLDTFLHEYTYLIHGNVIDVGGVRLNRRGTFDYTTITHENWEFVNISKQTLPDHQIDFSIPIDSNFNIKLHSYDVLICTEVLEYLNNIHTAFQNIRLLTKKNSILIISVPWMNTYHGDHEYDLARYSQSYLYRLFEHYNYAVIHNHVCGGLLSVIWDFLHRITYGMHHSRFVSFILKSILITTRQFCCYTDRSIDTSSIVTTGYFFVLEVI